MFDSGTIEDKLVRPNLLESHTAITRAAICTMSRFNCASSRLGVETPDWVSNPSTPRKSMSAFSRRRLSSAMGPTSEYELLRNIPPVRMTSRLLPDSSLAMLMALVMMVRCLKFAQRAGDGRGGAAGVENDRLAFLHHLGGSLGDPLLLARMLHLALGEIAVGVGAGADRQRASVGAVDQAASCAAVRGRGGW